jgi:hypothetical protein
MSNFKNCPFCDSEKVSLNRDYDCESGGTFYSVKCDKCRASSGSSFAGKGDDCPNFYAGVANDWNSQVLRDQIGGARLEGLRVMNSSITNLTMDKSILANKGQTLIAEIEKLKAMNAELVEALPVLIDEIAFKHSIHLDNNIGGSTRRALIFAKETLAKAKELNQ